MSPLARSKRLAWLLLALAWVNAATLAAQEAEVDLLVVYTSRMEAAYGGPEGVEALVLASVVSANEAFAQSDCGLTLRLVGLERVEYEESAESLGEDLSRLMKRDGVMDEALDWRDKFGADLVYLFRRDDYGVDSIGTAWLLDSASGKADEGFGVASGNYVLGDLVLQHEVGHNLGAAHDRENSESGGLYSYSHGHRFDIDGSFRERRTVMAYAPGWQVNYFSNPSVFYEGAPTGVPAGQPESADNARTLRATAAAVASYRVGKPLAPLADAGRNLLVEDRNGDGFAEAELDGSASRDWDGIVSWQWTWEGGSASGETATARLPVGQHTVTLEVTDSRGARASDTLTVEALPYSKVTGVATGPDRLFQLRADGRVLASGANQYGELGLGSHRLGTVTQAELVELEGVVRVSSSVSHTLFLRSDGSLYASGRDLGGHLGLDGLGERVGEPVEVVGSGVATMAAGNQFSVWVTEEGALWGIGRNFNGSLADAPASASDEAYLLIDSGVAAVEVGASFTAALKEDGSLWLAGWLLQYAVPSIWEWDRFYEIESEDVVDIAAGRRHLVYRKADGSAWAMGGNSEGQLGLGHRQHSPGKWALTEGKVVRIGAGDETTLLVNGEGATWFAGRGVLTPDAMELTRSSELSRLVGNRAVATQAGSDFLAAVLDDGSVWAVGSNEAGQFGLGETAEAAAWTRLRPKELGWESGNEAPVPVVQVDPLHFAQDAEGIARLAVSAAGSMDDALLMEFEWSWSGGSANGFETELSVPVGVKEITLTARDWEGRAASATVPIEVRPLAKAEALAGSNSRFFVLRADGSLWGYGSNYKGALGLPLSVDRADSLEVLLEEGVRAVAAGEAFTLALKEDGSLWIAGDVAGWLPSEEGDSGDGFRILVESGVAAVAAGRSHGLYLTDDGSAFGVGSRQTGGLGLPREGWADWTEPLFAESIAGVHASHDESLAVTESGKLLVSSSRIGDDYPEAESAAGWYWHPAGSVESVLSLNEGVFVARLANGEEAFLSFEGSDLYLASARRPSPYPASALFGEGDRVEAGYGRALAAALDESGRVLSVGENSYFGQDERLSEFEVQILVASGARRLALSRGFLLVAMEDGSVWGSAGSSSGGNKSPWEGFYRERLVKVSPATELGRENTPPVAVAASEVEDYDMWGQGSQRVVMDGSGSYDDRFISRWVWRWNGRQFAGRRIVGQFPRGETKVSLQVIDGEGAESETELTVSIGERSALRDIFATENEVYLLSEDGSLHGSGGGRIPALYGLPVGSTTPASGLRIDLDGVKKVVGGWSRFLALAEDGSVWAAARRQSDWLGLKSDKESIPLRRVVEGGALDIAVGAGRSAVVRVDGSLWVHGSGVAGGAPLPQSALDVWHRVVSSDARAVAFFEDTIAYLRSDGSVWLLDGGDEEGAAWGAPQQILAGGARELAVGAAGILAIEDNGRLLGWGLGEGGLRGHIDPLPTTGDWAVLSEGPVVQAAAERSWLAWLEADGSVWALGESSAFRMGGNLYQALRAPQALTWGGVQRIATQSDSLIALHEGDGLMVLGRGNENRLSDGWRDAWQRVGDWEISRFDAVEASESGPVARAGADQELFIGPGSNSVQALLDGTASTADWFVGYWDWKSDDPDAFFSELGGRSIIWLSEGMHELTLTIQDANGREASDSISVQVYGESAFREWLASYFEQGAIEARSLEDWGNGDEDGDGLSNFLEWRLGSNPMAANLGPKLRIEPHGSGASLWLDGVTERSGVRLLGSDDLQFWWQDPVPLEWVEEKRAKAELGRKSRLFFKLEW